MMRHIISTVVGIAISVAVVSLVQFLGHMVYPPPAGMDPNDPDSIAKFVKDLPVGALLFVVAAWQLGSFSGAFAASWLMARGGDAPVSIIPAVIVGLTILAATLYMLSLISHPLWMMIAGVILPLPLAWLAAVAVNRSKQPDQAPIP